MSAPEHGRIEVSKEFRKSEDDEGGDKHCHQGQG